jgi:hypothetical protein
MVALLETMAAFSQKAELNQACLSVLFSSEFGQKRSFTGFMRSVSLKFTLTLYSPIYSFI